MQVNFKKLDPRARMPVIATDGSVAFDLFTFHEVFLDPGQTLKYPTGIAAEFPTKQVLQDVNIDIDSGVILGRTYDTVRYGGKLFTRSGHASRGLLVGGGVIDHDYRGDITLILTNLNRTLPLILDINKPVAQLWILPVESLTAIEVQELSSTVRGESGFGHTDARS